MRRGVLLVVPTLAALAVPGVADALWSATAGGSTRVVSATVAHASGFTAACGAKSKNGTSIVLTWTASPTSFVSGYEIVRSGSSSTTISVTGRTTETATDVVSDTGGSSYTYSIRALGSGWSSGTLASSTTISFGGKPVACTSS